MTFTGGPAPVHREDAGPRSYREGDQRQVRAEQGGGHGGHQQALQGDQRQPAHRVPPGPAAGVVWCVCCLMFTRVCNSCGREGVDDARGRGRGRRACTKASRRRLHFISFRFISFPCLVSCYVCVFCFLFAVFSAGFCFVLWPASLPGSSEKLCARAYMPLVCSPLGRALAILQYPVVWVFSSLLFYFFLSVFLCTFSIELNRV